MLWLAHGADPSPLTWDQALATFVLALGTVTVILGLGYRGLRPFLRDPGPADRKQVLTWFGVGVGLVACVLYAFFTSAMQQLSEPTQPESFHKHYVNHGGQVGMWQNYHVEVARDTAGEFRVWVSDAYRRGISPEYYSGTLNGAALEASLDSTYAFVRQPREVKSADLKLDVPGQRMTFKFQFDEQPGRTSMPAGFCAPTP
jgi:hypothetical protein